MAKPSQLKNPNVLIIGGGVAGIAAANTLARQGVAVNLVEKNSLLGGHAADWACMATDTCRYCAACLGAEMAAGLPDTERIRIHLNTTVARILGNFPHYKAELTGGTNETIDADTIIIATGFKPAVVPGLLGEAYRRSSQVITTADLNHMLKNDMPPACLPITGRPKLAFFQCVGSRNRELGKEYCSQVCCKVSLRQISKLLYLYPDARITLFYIDLQIIGKQRRSEFERLSKRISLVQGVPHEIFQTDRSRVSVIREDDTGGGRTREDFDLVVLSTGIHAAGDTVDLATAVNARPDPWGFVHNTPDLAAKGIHVVGCAQGPTDILSAKQQGICCAVDILEASGRVETAPSGDHLPVAVIGDGPAARNTAQKLSDNGYPVALFGNGGDATCRLPGVTCFPDAVPVSITGTTGDYCVLFSDGRKLHRQTFAAIVAATGSFVEPAGEALDLSEKILFPLKRFMTTLDTSFESLPKVICFWLDYSGPEHKVTSRQILQTALRLNDNGKQIFIIMEKMLVHALEGQQLYNSARKQGITFLRIKNQNDVLVQEQGQKIRFTVKESTLSRLTLSFESDCLVLPENRRPSAMNSRLAHLLKESLDTDGLLQSANVRYRPVANPKNGIFYIGSCHDDTDDTDIKNEIRLVLWSLHQLSGQYRTKSRVSVEINTEKCCKCLTCLRTCPHGAVMLEGGKQPQISPLACQGCGLCVSSCPALAIEIENLEQHPAAEDDQHSPITVFACEKSAAIAARQIRTNSNIRIRSIPCACSISLNLLLHTIEKGSKKIILASCHHDNCQSVKGHKTARIRTRLLGSIPGIDPSCIVHYPVAAGESARFESFLSRQI